MAPDAPTCSRGMRLLPVPSWWAWVCTLVHRVSCARSGPVQAPRGTQQDGEGCPHPQARLGTDDIVRRYRHSVTTDAELEHRVADLTVAVDRLFQVVNTVANNVPALANRRGPLDEVRKGLADVAVALKDARER
jgi:hypothetical protein